MANDIGSLLAQTANVIKSVTESAANPYQITINSVSAGNEEQSMNCDQIMSNLHGMRPDEVAQAAESFRQLGDTLNTMAGRLADAGNQLAGQWSGAAAAKAMTKFQELHDQTANLAVQAHTTAGVMEWVGRDVMPPFQQVQSPQVIPGGSLGASVIDGVMGGVGSVLQNTNGQAKADQAARQYMATLNQHLVTANQMLPASTAGPATSVNAGYGNTGHIVQPGSNLRASVSGGPNIGHTGSGGGFGGPFAPSAGAGHVSASPHSASLQSIATPSGGGGTVSPVGAGSPGGMATGGGSANPFSRMPMVPGGGVSPGGVPGEKGLPGEGGMPGESGLGKGGLPGEGVPGGGVPGESGLPTGAAGDAAGSAGATSASDAAGGAAGEAAGAAGAGAGEAGGMGAMPMTGAGGGGQQDRERQRQAWLHEDDNIWGLPEADIGPVIE